MSEPVANPLPIDPEGAVGHPVLWPVRLLAALVRMAVVVSLVMILIFTVGQVVDRHFFRTGFSAFDQYARLGLVWLTFLGIAIAFRERANIKIDLADHFLPPATVRRKAVVLDIVVLAVAAMMIVVGWRLLEVGAYQVLMDTPFTYEVMYGALLLSLVLLVFFLFLRLVDAAFGGRLRVDAPIDPHDHH
jgi:TRAP-type C4-dicarboxylate transport system permease small subunit